MEKEHILETDKKPYRLSAITGKRLPSKNQIKDKIKSHQERIELLKAQMAEHLREYNV